MLEPPLFQISWKRPCPRYQRYLLAQLRFEILPLRIEAGRFQNTKDPNSNQIRKLEVEERFCQICNVNKVEDEFHFICICAKYKVPRNFSQCLYN